MAIIVTEATESRAMGTPTTFVYDVGLDVPDNSSAPALDEYAAMQAAWNECPVFGDGSGVLTDVYWRGLKPRWPPNVQRRGHNEYRVSVDYEPLFLVEFDMMGEKTKKYMADSCIKAWIAADLPDGIHELEEVKSDELSKPSWKMINITDNSGSRKPQGVDVLAGTFNWTERWTVGPAALDYPYFSTLAKSVGKVNDGEFRGFPRGEVMFLGMSGRYVNKWCYEMDFSFSRRPTPTSIVYGGDTLMGNADKKVEAWDLVEPVFNWGEVTPETIGGSGSAIILTSNVDSVKVLRIVEHCDFLNFGVYPSIDFGFFLNAEVGWPFVAPLLERKSIAYSQEDVGADN